MSPNSANLAHEAEQVLRPGAGELERRLIDVAELGERREAARVRR